MTIRLKESQNCMAQIPFTDLVGAMRHMEMVAVGFEPHHRPAPRPTLRGGLRFSAPDQSLYAGAGGGCWERIRAGSPARGG